MRASTLKRHVRRLEHEFGLSGVCPTCNDHGKWVYVCGHGSDDDAPPGCPHCGRRNLIRLVYVDVPLPT